MHFTQKPWHNSLQTTFTYLSEKNQKQQCIILFMCLPKSQTAAAKKALKSAIMQPFYWSWLTTKTEKYFAMIKMSKTFLLQMMHQKFQEGKWRDTQSFQQRATRPRRSKEKRAKI